MKSNFVMMLTAITLFVALVIPVSVSAQEQPVTPETTHRYRLIDLGTLGGPRPTWRAAAGTGSPRSECSTITGR